MNEAAHYTYQVMVFAYDNNGPYYILQIIPSITDIMGGIKTNWDFQVLREDGSVIDHLYAIGSMTNRLYYNQWYVSGSFLTFAATSGKMAGAHAVNALE